MPDLARMIAEQGSDLRLRQAIVIGTPAGGVATIRFGGTDSADDIAGVHCLTSVALANGDAVEVLQQDGVLLVVGKVGPTDIGGGGVTDHGALTGLADDDHPQYATDTDLTAHAAAADPHAGYQKESEKNAASGYAGLTGATRLDTAHMATGATDFHTAPVMNDFNPHWTPIATAADLTAHAATAGHTHPNLASHDALGLATDAELATHAGAADPHTGYLKETDVSGLATPAIVLGTAAAAGTGTTPIRHNSTIAAFDATNPSTQAFADAAAVGAAAFAARRDHKHAMPANPVTAHEAAADPHTGYQKESEKDAANGYAGLDATGVVPDAKIAGTITRDAEMVVAIDNHANASDPHVGYQKESERDAANGYAGLDGSALVPDARIAATIARDSEVTAAVSAHAAAGDPHTGYLQESVVSGLATPAIVLGTASAAGTGTTPIRHNSTIAAFDATAPSTQAFADAAAVGSAAFAARRDHKHAMPANPVTAHEAAGNPHPGYATDGDLTTHAAAGDPHTGYVLESANVHLATFNTPGTLTVVAGKGRFRFPFAVTILGVTAAINTAPTGAAVILDVNKNGTTIFTTQGNRPTIAISGFATTTEPAPDVTAMAAGDYLTVDVDQIGSTIAGADLTVFVRYRPT